MRNFIVIAIISATLIYLAKMFDVALPWILNDYANDVLSIPIALELGKQTAQLLLKQPLRLNAFTVFSVVAYFSIYFEYYLPQFNSRYTADVFDVFAYALGGVIYWKAQDYPASHHADFFQLWRDPRRDANR